MQPHVAVIGAGVVGLATAAQLQRRGARVTLIDPAEPGEGCSFGNAGCLSRASVVPVGLPGLWKHVPGYLLDPSGPFRVDWRYLHRIAPWLWGLQRASNLERVNQIADALHPLLDPSIVRWRELAEWAGVPELIRQDGYAFVYESEEGFLNDRLGRALRQARGVRIEILTGPQIREFDPALSPKLTHMSWLPEQGHVPNPLRLSRALAQRLREGGASFVKAAARDFVLADGGVRSVVTDGKVIEVDAVVLAAGAHSKPLAAKLGSRVPLDTERGYHVMLPQQAESPRVPVCSGEGKFFVTPMESGLRVAGTVELAGLRRPPDYSRADVLAPLAKRMLPGIDTTIGQRWMGFRPSMPDSLPVLGRAPAMRNAYFNFGHGHVGLTASAPAGAALAELICAGGQGGGIDLAPYAAQRFA
jgi:D-amino-acid dehydrogenase